MPQQHSKRPVINLVTITDRSPINSINHNFRKLQAELSSLNAHVEPLAEAGQRAKELLDTYVGTNAPISKKEAVEYTQEFTINYAQKRISSSTTPPESPEDGDLWLDPSTQPPTFKRWNAETGEWEKLSATTFEELEGMIDKSQLPDRVIDSMKLAIDAVQSENLAPSSVDFENLMDDAVRGAKIAAEAVASIHIQNGAVNNDKLDNLAVTAEKLANGAVVEDKIFDGAVGTAKLADAAITSAKISEAAINEAHIAEAAVGTAAIQDLAVTNAKIANIHADKITSGVIAAERIAIGPLTQFAEGYDPTKIEVGGRNLFTNTEQQFDWDVSAFGESHRKNHNIELYQGYQDLRGQTVTISYEAKTEDLLYGTTNPWIGIELRIDFADSTYIFITLGQKTIKEGTSNGWIKYSLTRIIPDKEIVGYNNPITVLMRDATGKVSIKNIKLEKGNKATDWTPAPEDNPALLWQYEDTAYIDGGNIYANTITSNQIAAGAITTNELAANAVTANKIAANAVTANKIQAEAVGAQAIAANAILAKHIAAGEVTANHLAAEAVTADAIAAGAILSQHLSSRVIESQHISTEGLTAIDIYGSNIVGSDIVGSDIVSENSVDVYTYRIRLNQARIRSEVIHASAGVQRYIDMYGDQIVLNNNISGQESTLRITPQVMYFSGDRGIDSTFDSIRLRADTNNYVRISNSNGIYMLMSGQQRFAFIPGADTSQHWRIAFGSASLKSLGGSLAELQARSSGDSSYVRFSAGDFIQQSSRKLKKNIQPLNCNALDKVKQTPIYTYQFDYSKEKTPIEEPEQLGFVYEESPCEICDDRGGVSITGAVAFLWKAVQELTQKVEALEGGK